MLPWYTARVLRIEEATSSTRRFWFEIPELESFDFIPGQFVTLDLPIHEKPNKRWRSYSIASWPDGSNVFELIIVLLEGGAGTHYLFNEVQVGTLIPVRGPQGIFTLPDSIEKDIFLICTGTGVAPFRSMLYDIVLKKRPHKHIYLVFGCRMIADTLYAQELKELENVIHSYSYTPVYSREQSEGVIKGYVHAIYEDIIQQYKIEEAYFYLCGWKNMIIEAKDRILSLGYDKRSIHQELYG